MFLEGVSTGGVVQLNETTFALVFNNENGATLAAFSNVDDLISWQVNGM